MPKQFHVAIKEADFLTLCIHGYLYLSIAIDFYCDR